MHGVTRIWRPDTALDAKRQGLLGYLPQTLRCLHESSMLCSGATLIWDGAWSSEMGLGAAGAAEVLGWPAALELAAAELAKVAPNRPGPEAAGAADAGALPGTCRTVSERLACLALRSWAAACVACTLRMPGKLCVYSRDALCPWSHRLGFPRRHTLRAWPPQLNSMVSFGLLHTPSQ